MNKKILHILIFLMPVLLFPQSAENFSIHIRPALDVPLGEKSSLIYEDAAYLVGGGVNVSGQYLFPNLPLFYIEAD
ncbi:MAG: hypothetical protein GWN61_26855, partial [candidate division Zixibacteria bacterium]|nr:hypothetical protein [candidate division Zixibacteria bacterium]NIS49461.1 hypothetical protein [candidate division Zixibacteria bacterium]NIV09691.1 hypothetical protein [candidate division Zixibacteria bacterium]NIX59904.1 hypothetical protein [candidate division Zixibacteria bacterium]